MPQESAKTTRTSRSTPNTATGSGFRGQTIRDSLQAMPSKNNKDVRSVTVSDDKIEQEKVIQKVDIPPATSDVAVAAEEKVDGSVKRGKARSTKKVSATQNDNDEVAAVATEVSSNDLVKSSRRGKGKISTASPAPDASNSPVPPPAQAEQSTENKASENTEAPRVPPGFEDADTTEIKSKRRRKPPGAGDSLISAFSEMAVTSAEEKPHLRDLLIIPRVNVLKLQ